MQRRHEQGENIRYKRPPGISIVEWAEMHSVQAETGVGYGHFRVIPTATVTYGMLLQERYELLHAFYGSVSGALSQKG